MRRKSERNKSKTSPEKKLAESSRKSRRQSRRRKRSSSHSASEESDEAPAKVVAATPVETETNLQTDVKKKSSNSNSEEENQEQPVWKVKTADTSSGEIQKIKICLTRPPLTPERTEKPPRIRKQKVSSLSEEASSDDKPVKRKTRKNSPVASAEENSSQDNSYSESTMETEKDECLIIVQETNEAVIGEGKLGSSQLDQESEHDEYVQTSQKEEMSQPDITNTTTGIELSVSGSSHDAPAEKNIEGTLNKSEQLEIQNDGAVTLEEPQNHTCLTTEKSNIEISDAAENAVKNVSENEVEINQKNNDELHSEHVEKTEPGETQTAEEVSENNQDLQDTSTKKELENGKQLNSGTHDSNVENKILVNEKVVETQQNAEETETEEIVRKEDEQQQHTEEKMEMETQENHKHIPEEINLNSKEDNNVKLSSEEENSSNKRKIEEIDSNQKKGRMTPEEINEQNEENINKWSGESITRNSEEKEKMDSEKRSVSPWEEQHDTRQKSTEREISMNPEPREESPVHEETESDRQEEEPVRRRRKTKWNKSIKAKLPEFEHITSKLVLKICPHTKMLTMDEIKLESDDIIKEEKKRRMPKVEEGHKTVIKTISSPKEDDIEKEVSNIGLNRKISIVDDEASKLQPPPSPPKNPVSSVLFITNLVRPFTLKQLKELLSRTGKILEDGFWTDRIKSKCYVQYETEEEAEATRNALHGVQWPIGNGKKLIIDFGTVDAMETAKNPIVVETTAKPIVPEKIVEKVIEEKKEISDRWEKERTKTSVREWDLGKIPQDDERRRSRDRDRERDKNRDRSRNGKARERSIKRRHSSPSNGEHANERKIKKIEEDDIPARLMDDLFHKTKSTPSIYWLPLTPEMIAQKQQERLQRMAEHKRRLEESRRNGRDFGRGAPRSRRRSGRFDGD